MEVVDQLMVGVLFPHPARYGIGIVLVAVPSFAGKVAVPQSGVDFGDDWGALGWIPPIKRPEVKLRAEEHAKKAQPREARMGGFCHAPLDVKVKH